MNFAEKQQNAEGLGSSSKQWPDFYSILDSSPETDLESLRRSINTLYVQANEGSDHRELSTRFYNQVLSQKVLPQCRRILLNDQSRQAYNQQWYLHRDGADEALSYQDFIRNLTKGSGATGGLLLSNDEISILPSFSGSHTPPLSALKTPAPPTPEAPATPEAQNLPSSATEVAEGTEIVEGVEVIDGEEVIETIAPHQNALSSPDNPIVAQAQVLVVPRPVEPAPRKKASPVVPIVVGVLLLGIGGAAWNATRRSAATVAAAPDGTRPTLGHLYTLANNADFEVPKLASWVSSGGFTTNELDPNPANNDPVSGKAVLTFFSKGPYDIDVRQTVTGLKPGKYTLRSWGRQNDSLKTTEMFAEGYGGSRRTALLGKGWNWKMFVIKDIQVTSGQCTIGFNFKSTFPKGGAGNIDAVEFFHQ